MGFVDKCYDLAMTGEKLVVVRQKRNNADLNIKSSNV